MNQKNIIIFDGVCNLCNGFVKLILKLDKNKKFIFTFLQSEVADQFINDLKIQKVKFDSVVLIKEKNYYTKSEAILQIAKELGGVFWIFTLAEYLPKRFSDRVYDWVAGKRYSLFGKKSECRIPDQKYKDRFRV